MKRVARAVVLAWGLPMLAGVSISGAARADDAAPAAPAQAPSAAALAQQAATPNAVVSADATQAVMPPAPVSSQAKSKGFIADSHFDVLLRNYADVLDAKGGPHRRAWIQGVMANFESGYTAG